MADSDAGNYVVCGQNIAELKPTSELRYVPGQRDWNGNVFPRLQQKWVASAKMADGGGVWEEHRWRDIPYEPNPA